MSDWAESVAFVLIVALFFFFFIAYIVVSVENKELKAQLADPHHCVAVCVEEFEKYGC